VQRTRVALGDAVANAETTAPVNEMTMVDALSAADPPTAALE